MGLFYVVWVFGFGLSVVIGVVDEVWLVVDVVILMLLFGVDVFEGMMMVIDVVELMLLLVCILYVVIDVVVECLLCE